MRLARGARREVVAAIAVLLCSGLPSCLQAASISGIVSYSGHQTGTIWVVANSASNAWSTNYSAPLTITGAYVIAGIPAGSNYWVSAYLDSNGTHTNDAPEAKATYEANPLLLLADASGMALQLSDPDSDGDGMPDWWETKNGLSSILNDASGDPDLDGVSNLEEYLNGFDPGRSDSVGDGQSDYERLNGQTTAACYYDRNDRLVGIDYNRGANGFAIAYDYDGNGNIVRQRAFARDANTNGLPDLWEYISGLTNGPTTLYDDTDGDGWSNYQEWRAGSAPTSPSSVPDVRGVAGMSTAALQCGFMPSNFVMGVGQLDGQGAEEIVVGADGEPGSVTNSLWILSQAFPGFWSTQRVDVGSVGITSIAIGQPSNCTATAIYIGTRQARGTGMIMQVSMTAGGWQTSALSVGNTGEVAYVLGVRQGYGDVLAELAVAGSPSGQLVSLSLSNGTWMSQVVDTRTSHRGLGTTAARCGNSSPVVLRVLDGGGVQFGAAGLRMGADPTSKTMKALVVAGGGGGSFGGGGGAGGVVFDPTHAVAPQTYPVTVGDGGSFHASGSNSVFDTITAIGGGYGGGVPGGSRTGNGGNGGSGGGACYTAWGSTSAGLATQGSSGGGVGYGHNGGVGWPEASGGGGGAGSVGGEDFKGRAPGGDGIPNPISDSTAGEEVAGVYYLGGGGGGWYAGAGGKGGGGHNVDDYGGTSGMPNTGGGGGSAGPLGTSGCWGGSGVAVISYLDSDFCLYTISGGIVSTSGLCTIRTFVSNGTLVVGAPVTTIPEPTATSRLLWRGHSLASGYARLTNGTSVLYAFVDDKDLSGAVDEGDDFVVSECLVDGTNALPLTTCRVPLVAAPLSPAYGLACANYLNASNAVVFTGEPDGRVYEWTASDGMGPLQRQLFSAHYLGKAWHQMGAYRGQGTSGSGSEGLVGLCVAPDNADVCRVVYWEPQNQLWTPMQVPQTAPITRILPEPSSGGGYSRVDVRIWDAEGNRSLPQMQYSPDGTNWADASIWRMDGGPYSLAMSGVEAMPTGSMHRLIWNARQDLGGSYSNSVLLRIRSHDITLWGDWSTPVGYQVSVSDDSNHDGIPDAWCLQYGLDPLATNGPSSALGSADGTGVANLYKYQADLNPTNPLSRLELIGIDMLPLGAQVNWRGGTWATQVVEAIRVLGGTAEQWRVVFTNQPPTATTTNIIDAGATNQSLFYRVRAAR